MSDLPEVHPISGRKLPTGYEFKGGHIVLKPQNPADSITKFDPEKNPYDNAMKEDLATIRHENEKSALKKEERNFISLFREAILEVNKDPDSVRSEKKRSSVMEDYWVEYSIEQILKGGEENIKHCMTTFQHQRGSKVCKNFSPETTNIIIVKVICKYLERFGKFIKDRNGLLYYFIEINDIPKLYRAYDGKNIMPEFESFLYIHFDLFNVKRVVKNIIHYANSNYENQEVYNSFYYDRPKNVLYIHNRNGYYYRLDGSKITKQPNGREILFCSQHTTEIEYIPKEERGNTEIDILGVIKKTGIPLWDLLFNRTNFVSKTALTQPEQMAQLLYHTYCIPFGNILNSKPIMAFIGDRGSGKTFSMNNIGKFLIKEGFTVRRYSKKDEDNFIVAVVNNPCVFIDNLDKMYPWLEDCLAAISTGATIARRILFTTWDEGHIKPNCFVAITSRTPGFNRIDIVDRILIFNVERFEMFIDEDLLERPLIENLDFFWSEFLDDLNQIVRVMGLPDEKDFKTTHRMAGWVKQAYYTEKALNVSQIYDFDFEYFLTKIHFERAFFQLYNNPILEIFEEYTKGNSGIWKTAKNLVEKLKKIDEDLDISPKKLASFLKNNNDALAVLFDLKVKVEKNKNQKQYCFGESMEKKKSSILSHINKNEDKNELHTTKEVQNEEPESRNQNTISPPCAQGKSYSTLTHEDIDAGTGGAFSKNNPVYRKEGDNSFQEVLEFIHGNSSEDGVSEGFLETQFIDKREWSQKKLDDVLHKLLIDGELYNPKPGYCKILE